MAITPSAQSSTKDERNRRRGKGPSLPQKKRAKYRKKDILSYVNCVFMTLLHVHFANVECKSAIWIFSFFQPALSNTKKIKRGPSPPYEKNTTKNSLERERREEYGEVVKKEECGVRRRQGKKHSINATCERFNYSSFLSHSFIRTLLVFYGHSFTFSIVLLGSSGRLNSTRRYWDNGG